jgi:[ribosomal protein S5]-alanine N-acetyltransferase
VRLLTARLLLREFEPDDWRAVLSYRGDPRYQRFYSEHDCSEDGVREQVAMFIAWQQAQPRFDYQWVAVLPGTNEVVGNCGLRRRSAGSAVADIGFELSPAHWGAGYATELAERMLAFGFGELALHRIEAHCIADNLASSRVLEKVGMQREGLLREKQRLRGCWWDVFLYAVLEHEWRRADG